MATQSNVGLGVAVEDFVSYAISIPRALDAIGAGALLACRQRIVLKPNLVNHSPHPITTPPACIEAIIDYIRSHGGAGIAVAEGSGAVSYTHLRAHETPEHLVCRLLLEKKKTHTTNRLIPMH